MRVQQRKGRGETIVRDTIHPYLAVVICDMIYQPLDTVVSVGRRNIRESVVDFHAMVGMDIADGSHQAVGASKKFWQQLFAPIAGADQGHGNFFCHDSTCTL